MATFGHSSHPVDYVKMVPILVIMALEILAVLVPHSLHCRDRRQRRFTLLRFTSILKALQSIADKSVMPTIENNTEHLMVNLSVDLVCAIDKVWEVR